MAYLFTNNSLSTLAAGISDVATTATLATGTGARMPSPTGSDYFMLTLTDAATGLVNEIVKVTARAADVVTIVRAQEGTSALPWSAGDGANALITAGYLNDALQSGDARTRLAADTTFYVRSDGNNANSGLVNNAGGAWLTIQHAFDALAAGYDLGGFAATVQMSNGTYAGATMNGQLPGQVSSVILQGNTGSPTSVIVGQIVASSGAILQTQFLKIVSAGYGLLAQTDATITIGASVDFGACTSGHMVATYSGHILRSNNYAISGSAPSHISADAGGTVIADTRTITLTGSPVFASSFAIAGQSGTILDQSSTYSGSAGAVTPRYLAVLNGVINTNGGGANYFPGTTAGSTATGGQYV